jgi:hypothetical protein
MSGWAMAEFLNSLDLRFRLSAITPNPTHRFMPSSPPDLGRIPALIFGIRVTGLGTRILVARAAATGQPSEDTACRLWSVHASGRMKS